jgi:uncharacterized protein YceH (UPF0502 family)
MHRFDELTDVQAGLQKLMEREPALVAVLPRQPGTKESRYAHLLSGGVESIPMAAAATPVYVRREGGEDSGLEERVAGLETIVAELRRETAILRQKIEDLFGDG